MKASINGIIPVMLTPFTQSGEIDWEGYESLIAWYIDNGAQALFAVCQSSEMQFLSLRERVDLAKFTAQTVNGRIPVIASGHVSNGHEDQKIELSRISETGVDGVVLVTNRMDTDSNDKNVWRANLDGLLAHLPKDMPLGLYECPAPYRRLLSDDEVSYCADSGRFVILKDVSCDLETVKRRIELTRDTPLKICNANAAIAWPALQAGSAGFCGVMLNVHPDLYRWLQDHGASHPELAQELSVFLVLSSMCELMGYPKIAKVIQQRLGTFASADCRVITFDINERYWGLSANIQNLEMGTNHFRSKIRDLAG